MQAGEIIAAIAVCLTFIGMLAAVFVHLVGKIEAVDRKHDDQRHRIASEFQAALTSDYNDLKEEIRELRRQHQRGGNE